MGDVRKVPIKQLYKSLSKELGDLPFIVTKGGLSVAMVTGLDNKPKAIKSLDKKQENPSMPAEKSRPVMGYSKDKQLGRKSK